MRVLRCVGLAPVVVAVLAVALWGSEGRAGFASLPLTAEIDLAKTVVVGEITEVAKEPKEESGRSWARATVSISETLKGTPVKEVTMLVMVPREGPRDGGKANPMQARTRFYRKGDAGIFVIMSDDRPSQAYGLLPKGQVEEVKTILAGLDKRRWSEEVEGLKCWAGSDMSFRAEPAVPGVVVLAVKNVSTKPIFLPRSAHEGVVTAVATGPEGKSVSLRGLGDRSPAKGVPAAQPALEPGETRYLHPDGENYGGFILPADLAAGRYEVRVTLTHGAKGGLLGGSKDKPVTLWTGTVAAPVLTMEVQDKAGGR